MAKQQRKPPAEAPDALAAFARIFWDEAIKQVEEEIEAEERAAKGSNGAAIDKETRAP
jgi:hypothetical protein